MMENIPIIAAGAGLVGLVLAFVLYQQVNKVKIDNEVVADITDEIQKGAMAFLFAEYKVLSIFVVVVGAVLAWLNGADTAIAFFAGAIASVAAGFSGMRAATSANGRTTMAAKNDGKAGALAVSAPEGRRLPHFRCRTPCSASGTAPLWKKAAARPRHPTGHRGGAGQYGRGCRAPSARPELSGSAPRPCDGAGN